MSNRSFINRAAEEGRQRLVAGRVVAQLLVACPVDRLQRVEHGVDRLVGIGDLALALHGVEIVHVGLIGLFIVAEHTHWKTLLFDAFQFDAFSKREPVPLRRVFLEPKNAIAYSTTFGTRKK